MALILQILGALFLLLLLLVVGGYFIVRFKLRQALQGLQDLDVGAFPTTPPARIELEPLTEQDWSQGEEAEGHAAALCSLGFVEAGRFSTDVMGRVNMIALVHEHDRLVGVAYEHTVAGVWMDLVSRYEDGTTSTYTSAPHGSELDQRPGHGKMFLPQADAETMYRRILDGRPDRALLPIAGEDFKSFFEQAYADEMDWRLARGGPSDAELRAIAERSEEEVSEEVIEATREALTWEYLEQLEEVLRDNFLRECDITAAEWEKVRESLVFIHDKLPMETVTAYFQTWDEEEDADPVAPEPPEGATSRQAFRALNEAMEAPRRFELLGRVSRPLAAEVYKSDEAWEG